MRIRWKAVIHRWILFETVRERHVRHINNPSPRLPPRWLMKPKPKLAEFGVTLSLLKRLIFHKRIYILSENPGSQFRIRTGSHSARISLVWETWMKIDFGNSCCIGGTPRHAGISSQQMSSMFNVTFSMRLKKIPRLSFVFTWHGVEFADIDFYNRENGKWRRRKISIRVFASEESQPQPHFPKQWIAIKILEEHWHCPGSLHFHWYPNLDLLHRQ